MAVRVPDQLQRAAARDTVRPGRDNIRIDFQKLSGINNQCAAFGRRERHGPKRRIFRNRRRSGSDFQAAEIFTAAAEINAGVIQKLKRAVAFNDVFQSVRARNVRSLPDGQRRTRTDVDDTARHRIENKGIQRQVLAQVGHSLG